MKTKILYLFLSLLYSHSILSQIYFEKVGEYRTDIFDKSATEIITFDTEKKLIFSTNGYERGIDIIDISNPASPIKINKILLNLYGHHANSVDFYGNNLAVAVENKNPMENGQVVFFDREGNFVSSLVVGAMPDMLSFSKDGCYLAVACEGEPSGNYTTDPEGVVALIDLRNGVSNITNKNITLIHFDKKDTFNTSSILVNDNIGTSTFGQDLEPEYLSFDEEGNKLYVCLQENNAIAVINVESKKVEKIVGLGFKDISLDKNGMDINDKDKQINIQPIPHLFALYQPDAIKCIRINGQDYILTANEGETRKNSVYSNVSRSNKLNLDSRLKNNKNNLGRLKVHNTLGDVDGDGDLDNLYTFGARSFSIWDTDLNQIYDSGNVFENQIAQSAVYRHFNANNDDQNSFDKRSDDKGCEPEGVIAFSLKNKYYALIGLDRMGGFMCFDITDPFNPLFQEYVTDRNFEDEVLKASGLGPEGLLFIDKNNSPINVPLVLVANEVSGQISIFKIGVF